MTRRRVSMLEVDAALSACSPMLTILAELPTTLCFGATRTCLPHLSSGAKHVAPLFPSEGGPVRSNHHWRGSYREGERQNFHLSFTPSPLPTLPVHVKTSPARIALLQIILRCSTPLCYLLFFLSRKHIESPNMSWQGASLVSPETTPPSSPQFGIG